MFKHELTKMQDVFIPHSRCKELILRVDVSNEHIRNIVATNGQITDFSHIYEFGRPMGPMNRGVVCLLIPLIFFEKIG